MEEKSVLETIASIVRRKGIGDIEITLHSVLQDIPFDSLDFAELLIRVEKAVGRPLNFEGREFREIRTVGDVVTFFDQSS